MPWTAQAIAERLRGKQTHNGWQAHCPAHDDKQASLSISTGEDGRVLLHCHAGCSIEDILQKVGLRKADLFSDSQPKNTPPERSTIEAEYNYVDANNTLLYQSVRFNPKRFVQRRPDGKGGWVWDMHGITRMLYRLPQVLKAVADGEPVFIPEGEKDCDNLVRVGLAATTNVGGAGNWRDEYNDALHGAQVVILPDNDEAGRKHALKVATSLHGIAASIRMVELPNLPEKGDVSDWLAAGGTGEELWLMAQKAPEWEPADESRGSENLPIIDAGIQDLRAVSDLAIEALCKSNDSNPRLFLRGGPARIETDDTNQVITRELTPDRLRHELARAARWVRFSDKGDMRDARPPMDVVRDVLAAPEFPLPVLVGITSAPIFGPDGTLQMEPGYHKQSRTYYAPDKVRIPDIPDSPASADIEHAKDLVLTELFGDFPFAAESDQAHAVALLLLPFVRTMIQGPTPLHLAEASSQGSGKGLLADVALYPGLGTSTANIPPLRDEDELRKTITARLMEGRAAVLFDNVTQLDSNVLAAALTSTMWSDRVLSKNTTVSIPVRCLWAATANNATVSTDIARRCVRIRLTPKTDMPWLRTEFRHASLRTWVEENRGELIWAALTLVKAWIVAGRPKPKVKPLGSFEAWSNVIGGILEHVGINGFLGNIMEFYDVADTEGAVWRRFVKAWWNKHGNRTVTAGELFEIAQSIDGFDLGKATTERAQKTAFGMRLGRQRERVFENYQIMSAGTRQRAQLWQLVDVNLVNLSEPFTTMLRTREKEDENNIMREAPEKVHQGSQGSLKEVAAAEEEEEVVEI